MLNVQASARIRQELLYIYSNDQTPYCTLIVIYMATSHFAFSLSTSLSLSLSLSHFALALRFRISHFAFRWHKTIVAME